MGFFSKSTCSKCCCCECSCRTGESEVKVISRKYTYTGEDELWDDPINEPQFPLIPTERVVLGEGSRAPLFYNQVDNEFFAKNILDHVPLVAYANRPFFRKIDMATQISQYKLPTVSYVADPVYVRRREECRLDCGGPKGRNQKASTCCCISK